jgi:hypothetical protein
MATILTKKKDTTGAPVAGDLTNSTGGAELAVNTADKRLYTKDSGGNVVEVGTNPGAAVTFTAGTVSAPAITTTGDTNTGIFFPAADTIAFAEGGTEVMRINSSGNVGIGTTSPQGPLEVVGVSWFTRNSKSTSLNPDYGSAGTHALITTPTNMALAFATSGDNERMRIDSSGNVGIGTSSPSAKLDVNGAAKVVSDLTVSDGTRTSYLGVSSGSAIGIVGTTSNHPFTFITNNTERARITSGGDFLVQKTSLNNTTTGVQWGVNDYFCVTNNSSDSNDRVVMVNRQASDGVLIEFRQANTAEGNISVSGNTVSYNAFCGGHWSQLQQGRGYNPDIPRGTVMSSIGEMAEWKSVIWTETIEHPAIPAVEAKEAVLDEEGNVVEPAVEVVEGKDAWTESIPHRDDYLGNLPIGATFEEDGFTKTVVDDGNERLPKVKISDVVGDKAVYGVFQTYDGVQDMLISSLGAFVVRIAAGVTVQIGDLLESNGDGCAKVQDDDVIRSKTIGKVTSTVATATYADGSYTVPCVLYCG